MFILYLLLFLVAGDDVRYPLQRKRQQWLHMEMASWAKLTQGDENGDKSSLLQY
jgi:hypothetical protein